MIKIREAKPNDAKSIKEAYYYTWLSTYPNKEYGITTEDIQEQFRDAFTEENVKKYKEKMLNNTENRKIFIAEYDSKIVGVCVIFIREEFNQLQSIYVLPEYQGKGVGKMFWNECQKYFDKSKKTIVQVAIYNTYAIKFYEKIGFKDNGKRFTEERHRMPISKVIIPEMEMEII